MVSFHVGFPVCWYYVAYVDSEDLPRFSGRVVPDWGGGCWDSLPQSFVKHACRETYDPSPKDRLCLFDVFEVDCLLRFHCIHWRLGV